ncbi:hypothetical protein JCM11641_003478 [Rhodosporidiobolus odoratus]
MSAEDAPLAPPEVNPSSPSTSVASSSSSWQPVTTEQEASPAHSLIESRPPSAGAGEGPEDTLAPLDTQLDDVSVSSELENETPVAYETPVEPTWSRSRLPVAEEDDGLSPVVDDPAAPSSTIAEDGDEKEEAETPKAAEDTSALADAVVKAVEAAVAEVAQAEDGEEEIQVETEVLVTETEVPAFPTVSPPTDDDAPTPTHDETTPAKPAFVLTRPTLAGENETVSITQPSTPSASIKDEDEEVEKDEGEEPKEQPKKEEEVITRAIKINTSGAFLRETKSAGHFFASPVTATEFVPNSAIEPSSKTQAFFDSPFAAAAKTRAFFDTAFGPSPPRPGEAFITELSDVEITVKKSTPAEPPADRPGRRGSGEVTKSSQSTDGTRPLISPPEQELRRGSRRHRESKSRSRSPVHSRRKQPQPDVHSDSESDDAPRPSFHFSSRTIVSSAVSKLRRDVPPPPRNHHHEKQSHHHHHPHAHSRHREQRAEPRAPPVQQQREERPSRKSCEDEPKSLASIIGALKGVLEREPTAFYAVKGLLADYEEKNARFFGGARGGVPREAPARREEPLDRRPLQPETQGYRHPARPSKDQFTREHPQLSSRDRPVPSSRYSLTQTSDEGSDTEIEIVKVQPVKSGKPEKVYQYKGPSLERLTRDSDLPIVSRYKSPTPPSYPPHLSPRRLHGRSTAGGSSSSAIAAATAAVAPPLVRPVPVRPNHPSSTSHAVQPPVERDDPLRALQARGTTLTVAQAAQLAQGLGHESQAEELRRSGLRAKDKVTKLELAAASSVMTASKSQRSREKDRQQEQQQPREKDRVRRHSFDSVADLKPAKREKEKERVRSKKSDDVIIPVDLGIVTTTSKNRSALAGAGNGGKAKEGRPPAGGEESKSTLPSSHTVVFKPATTSGKPRLDHVSIPKNGQHPYRRRSSGKDNGIYPSPTVEHMTRPTFYFGSGGANGSGALGGKTGGEGGSGDKLGKGKRGRELSYPQGKSKALKDREDSTSFDFDDFF